MNSQLPAANSRPGSGQTGGRRRFAASLLVGWFAFWLNGAVLACCAGLTPNAMSKGEAVLANGPAAESSISDHGEPLRSACTDLAAPMGDAASAAPGPADRPDSFGANFIAPIRGIVAPSVLSSTTSRFDATPLPHVPLYLRTARLLI